MIRVSVSAVALICLLSPPISQSAGVVFTESEIRDPHLMRRPVATEGREWMALQGSAEGSRLESADVQWIASEEFGDSVFQLTVQPAEPLLLFADAGRLSIGPITTLTRFEQPLSTESPLTFELDERTYGLSLRGTDPAMCDATVTLTEGSVSQELYFPEAEVVSCDEPHFSIQWVGDLDRDGRLDLVATFSPKYSYYPRRLFLSSAAAGGELVGLAAAFDGAAA